MRRFCQQRLGTFKPKSGHHGKYASKSSFISFTIRSGPPYKTFQKRFSWQNFLLCSIKYALIWAIKNTNCSDCLSGLLIYSRFSVEFLPTSVCSYILDSKLLHKIFTTKYFSNLLSPQLRKDCFGKNMFEEKAVPLRF